MKQLLTGLCLAVLSVSAFADAAFLQSKSAARWALNYIETTKNPAQRARYMADINRYGAILQEYIGQKPVACDNDPHAFISRLEKLAAAQSDAELKAEAAQRAAAARALAPNIVGRGDFEAQQQEQRMRRLENESFAQRIRAREAAEQQAAAAQREAYRNAVGR